MLQPSRNEMVTLWQEVNLYYKDEWDCPTYNVRYKKKEENDRVYVFLVWLNYELNKVRRILGRKTLPSIRELFSDVHREETRCKVMLKRLESKERPKTASSKLVSRGIDSNGEKQKRP